MMAEDKHGRRGVALIRYLFMLGFFFFSGLIFSFVFGWLHRAPSSDQTPEWLAIPLATFFLLMGLLVLLADHERLAWLHKLMIWMLVICLAIPFNWVAFGEGERQFGGTSFIIGIFTGDAPGEMEGRIAFGLFGLLLDVLVLWMPLRWLKEAGKQ